MPVIIQGNNGKNQKSPMSSWIGYGAVAVFGIAVVASALLGGPKPADPLDPEYRYNDYKDLADMPFSDEEAEAELLSSVSYRDIAKNDLISALFSEDEKEARQAEDAANGAPPPPDEDYAQAAKEKAKVKQAKEKYRRSRTNAINARKERTSKGQMSSQSGIKVGSGAGGGVSHSVWRSDDKQYDTSSSAGGKGSSLSGQLVQNIKDGSGRGGGFMQAYNKSKEAANTDDLEAAHRLAADAFQNAGDLEGDLKGELEKNAEGLDINKMMGELDKDKEARAANTLDEALDKAKKDKDKKDNKKDFKCDGLMMNGSFDMACTAGTLMNMLMDVGKQALTSILSKKDKNGMSPDQAAEVGRLEEQIKSETDPTKKGNLAAEAAYYKAGGKIGGWDSEHNMSVKAWETKQKQQAAANKKAERQNKKAGK